MPREILHDERIPWGSHIGSDSIPESLVVESFQKGLDTASIAPLTGVPEYEVARLLWRHRCRET